MKTVSMHEAKTHLSRLVRDVRMGREPEIIIAVGKVPAARLVPFAGASRRVLGTDRGLIRLAPDFDAVDEEIADLFEGVKRRTRARRHATG
jgi:antitoxin (DNA-binding transcriptional repressor) of toxin-antitoxin stability system